VILGTWVTLASDERVRPRPKSSDDPQDRARSLGLAAKGLPAVRAALHGARLGAGAALDAKIVERLGIGGRP
jgi:hypothetical protein